MLDYSKLVKCHVQLHKYDIGFEVIFVQTNSSFEWNIRYISVTSCVPIILPQSFFLNLSLKFLSHQMLCILIPWIYVTGPAFWGLINPEWSLCNKGRRQSPVNLEPDKLLFDPNLRFLHIDKHRVNVSC